MSNEYFFYLNLFSELLVIIFTILAYHLWYKYGKEKYSPPVITFYPPKDLNCLQVSLIFKGSSIYGCEIASLIFYLAVKGYIKFKVNNISITKADCIIYKLKDYDGTNRFEKTLMNAIFYNQNYISLHDLRLKKDFRSICNNILDDLTQEIKDVFNEKNNLNNLKMYLLWSGVLLFSSFSVADFKGFPIQVFLYFISFSLIFNSILGLTVVNTIKSLMQYNLYFFLGIFFIFFQTAISNTKILDFSSFYYIFFIFNIICFFVTTICFANMDKKNNRGKEIYQQLLGFKKFLDLSEKKKFEILAKEDQEEYYQILPYEIAFKSGAPLIKILKKPPSWWEGKFDKNTFNNLLFHLNICTGKQK